MVLYVCVVDRVSVCERVGTICVRVCVVCVRVRIWEGARCVCKTAF